MDRAITFTVSGLLVLLVVGGVFYTPGGNDPDSEMSSENITVDRKLPQEAEEGETVPVTLNFRGSYESIEVSESFTGVEEGQKIIEVDDVENSSTVFYQIGPFEESGEVTFSGEVNGTAIEGDKTLEIVESDDIFLATSSIDESISTEALVPEELGGFPVNDSYSQDGSEGLVRKSSGVYYGDEDSIYLSVSRYNSSKTSESEVNRIARQQIDAGNRDKVERVTLSTDAPALETETVNNRSIVNWVHGDLVFEVEAVNPVELAGKVDRRYLDELQ